MDVLELIKNRRAVYPVQYNDEPITQQEISEILSAANWAPTHRRTEPWRFKVFHGEAQKRLASFMAATYKRTTDKYSERTFQKMTENSVKAGCVIAICFKRDEKESVPEWEEIASTAMAVQNMWLMAANLDIGSYWSTPGVKDHFGDFVKLEEGERCLGFFYMGKYDDPLPPGTRKTSIEEKTEWM